MIQMGVDQVIFGHLTSDMQIQNSGRMSVRKPSIQGLNQK